MNRVSMADRVAGAAHGRRGNFVLSGTFFFRLVAGFRVGDSVMIASGRRHNDWRCRRRVRQWSCFHRPCQ